MIADSYALEMLWIPISCTFPRTGANTALICGAVKLIVVHWLLNPSHGPEGQSSQCHIFQTNKDELQRMLGLCWSCKKDGRGRCLVRDMVEDSCTLRTDEAVNPSWQTHQVGPCKYLYRNWNLCVWRRRVWNHIQRLQETSEPIPRVMHDIRPTTFLAEHTR